MNDSLRFIDCEPLKEEIARLTAELAEAQAFKDYVHKRLDDAGVPVDPPSPHRDAGCRIGGRLDWLLAELAAAKDELRSKDENYTPLLDSYAANCQRLSDELAASQERERVLREAVKNAYGILWHVNNEPGTPNQFPHERASYEARKVLRDLITNDERGEGINAARAALGEP